MKMNFYVYSLGNMLVSAAIHDWDMAADKYFALNGAVPAEAYDSMVDVRTNGANRLLHPDWRGYEARTWSANYHQLFTDTAAFPADDRANLTWRGRFSKAAAVLYNFWSSGDEVLEVAPSADLNILDGVEWDWQWAWPPVSPNTRRYVWHKQALFKGRSRYYGTTWAGWKFERPSLIQADANALTEQGLRSSPVFRHNPSAMFASNIVFSTQNNLLARGIPELSFPIGYTNIDSIVEEKNIDLNTDINLRRKDKKWPQRSIDFDTPENTRPNRWLHTDLINVAYYYTHRLYEAIVTKGELNE